MKLRYAVVFIFRWDPERPLAVFSGLSLMALSTLPHLAQDIYFVMLCDVQTLP